MVFFFLIFLNFVLIEIRIQERERVSERERERERERALALGGIWPKRSVLISFSKLGLDFEIQLKRI